LGARLEKRDEQANRQGGTDPNDGIALKGLLELEREIQFVAQPAGVAHYQLARSGGPL
jgi:hypothetical protein